MSTTGATTEDNLPKPLSAYNLYYRYKRIKIIQAASSSKKITSNTTKKVLSSPPGLEDYSPAARAMIAPDELDGIRECNIRRALEGQLFSKDKRNQVHRKSSHEYGMSFLEVSLIKAS